MSTFPAAPRQKEPCQVLSVGSWEKISRTVALFWAERCYDTSGLFCEVMTTLSWLFSMRRPMQGKFAAKAAHGPRCE